jgi:hypothetical protein
MPRENVSDLLAIRITAGEHSADTILWPALRPSSPCWSMRYGTAIETAACQCFRSDGGQIDQIQSGTQSECFPPVAVKGGRFHR